ncbi:MAG: GTPase HflX [Flavobacteriales bacterium]|jgi:GTP-binding protein HflX|nr:GTPase HflX [Flavobacteriales bacterium]MBK6755829.1 GTPase HflX [Flavobacteriales bacterium]MBK7270490.1 GTPase HflX [Flavobacteriales bacterium]MBK9073842.1 GTPase HflX [Flavobacteriales bacterium]MBK9539954.1 GTPase HflX [Flavobacteriales bacterium]
MIDPLAIKGSTETAVLIGLITDDQDQDQVKEYLDELEFLATTAEIRTLKRFTQRLHKPDGRTYVGSGKLAEVKAWVLEHEAQSVIFDDELSPAQQRNLEKELGLPVLDRPRLILDIFARRARTAHAKTQVELAQYEYMLPRLTKLWTHLERQRGGTGTRGGAGEKEIETDRRLVRDRIALLKAQLRDIDRQKSIQRGNRGKLVRVALVGYTNVGKSTVMNLLSKSDVFAENKLFATLDTTVRKVVLGNLPFLLSDTVGFIRKLPHQLIESFKSTLDETREADLLLHVVDISHHNFEEQYGTVKQTLNEIGAGDRPVIVLFNKIDAYRPAPHDPDDLAPKREDQFSLEELKETWMARMDNAECLFISATARQNVDGLRRMLYQRVKAIHLERYPYESDLLYKDEYLEGQGEDAVAP